MIAADFAIDDILIHKMRFDLSGHRCDLINERGVGGGMILSMQQLYARLVNFNL